MNEEKKSYTFLHILLIVAIAVVTNLFVFYSLEVVEPSPRYENFCTEDLTQRTFNTEEACVETGGQWTSTPMQGEEAAPQKGVAQGYCNATYSCQKTFEKANEEHSGFAFLVLITVGGLLFVASMILQGSSVVRNGLALAGLLSILIGSISNWTYLYPLVKVGLLGALLALILWFAWNKFKD